MKAPRPDQETQNDRLPVSDEEDRDRQATDRRWRDAVTRYFSILQEWSMKDRQDDLAVGSSADTRPHSQPSSRKLT